MRLSFLATAALLALLLTGCAEQPGAKSIAVHSVKVDLPADTERLPPGPGAEVAGQCLICHSAGMMLRQPALPQERWKAIVQKMKNSYGAPVRDADIETLSAYFARISAAPQAQ